METGTILLVGAAGVGVLLWLRSRDIQEQDSATGSDSYGPKSLKDKLKGALDSAMKGDIIGVAKAQWDISPSSVISGIVMGPLGSVGGALWDLTEGSPGLVLEPNLPPNTTRQRKGYLAYGPAKPGYVFDKKSRRFVGLPNAGNGNVSTLGNATTGNVKVRIH